MSELDKMLSEDILTADRVLDAGEKTRRRINTVVAVGCGTFTAISLASNPIGWGASVIAVGASMVRGVIVTHAVTTLWHHGEIRSKAGAIRLARDIMGFVNSKFGPAKV